MKRRMMIAVLAALFAAFVSPVCALPYTTDGVRADLPTINNYPALFVAVASGTGTATQYLTVVPLKANASGELLVSSNVTVGTVTVNPMAPYTTIQTTAGTATAGSTLVTPMANRRFVTLMNLGTETVWIKPGAATAVVSSGFPVYTGQYFSMDLDPSVGLPYIASTSTVITIMQGY